MEEEREEREGDGERGKEGESLREAEREGGWGEREMGERERGRKLEGDGGREGRGREKDGGRKRGRRRKGWGAIDKCIICQIWTKFH